MTIADELEALGPLDGRHVLLWRTEADDDDVSEILNHLIAAAQARGERGLAVAAIPMVIRLQPGESMEVLDEEAMKEAGWVRDRPAG